LLSKSDIWKSKTQCATAQEGIKRRLLKMTKG
jgi:hypothetical protein